MLSPEMLRAPSLGRQLVHSQCRTSSLLKLHDVMFTRTLGVNYAKAADEELEMAFHCWNARVKASLPPEKLLIFNSTDGWAPLCAFLGVPKPNVAYPHTNRREVMREVLNTQLRRAKIFDGIIRLFFVLSIIVVGYFSFTFCAHL